MSCGFICYLLEIGRKIKCTDIISSAGKFKHLQLLRYAIRSVDKERLIHFMSIRR